MGEKYFDKVPESYITTENAEKAIDDAYKRGKAEMLSIIEEIKAEIQHWYHAKDKSFNDGLSTALEIISKHIKEYTE